MTTKSGRYQVIRGVNRVMELTSLPGVYSVSTVYGEPDVVEVVMSRNPERFPLVVKDQTCGNVILHVVQSRR